MTASCSDSQEDDALVVAETQSFVLQAKESDIENLVCPESSGEEGDQRPAEGASFQLGLSDSSHLQERAQALAMESTQAFVLVEEANRGPSSSSPTVLSEYDARKVCVEDEDTHQQGVQVNVAMEATQAYISGHCSDSEDETDDDEARDIATVETQAFNLHTSFTLATAETQPMCVLEEGSILDKRENNKAVPLMPKHSDNQTQPLPETQPVLLIDEEENIDEDSMPLLRRRKAQPLQLEEEQTQPLASCDVGLLETQPVSCIDDEELTDEDPHPVSQTRKAKPLELEVEQTQPLASCDITLLEAQPTSFINADNVDSVPVLQKSKVKPLQSEDEQMQPHASCDVSQLETQPVPSLEDDDDDDNEDSLPVLRKRKTKPLEQLEEEQTQSLSSCNLTETQPVDLRDGDEQSDEDDSFPGPRRKQTRPLPSQDEDTQTLVGSCLSAGSQPALTGEDGDSDDNSVIGFSRRKAKLLESQEEESQTLSLTASEKLPMLADDIDESEDVHSSPGLRKRQAKPLAIKGDDSQSLIGPAVPAFGTRLSGREAAGQGGDNNSQSESSEGTSRNLRAGISKLGEEEEVVSAGCAETPQRQTGENLSPYENDTSNVEKNGEAKRQAKGKIPKTQTENQVEENKVSRNGGLTKEQQAMQIDTSDQNPKDMERSEEKKMQMVETERKKNASKKGKKSEVEHETMVEKGIVKRRKEREDKERSDRVEKEKKQMDKIKDKEPLEIEKAEKEQKKLEGEEKERLAGERQEKEENRTLPKAQMGRRVSARTKHEVEEKSINHQLENQPSFPAARGRRATRRTIAAVRSAEPEHHASSDDIPVRRTRSRSNSSNSVSSERSTAGLESQQSQGRGRGRGRGARRCSEPPSAVMTSSSSGRKSTTTAASSKRNSKARGQMEVKNECTEVQVTPSASTQGEGQRRGRKRTSGADTQDVSSSSCKISKAVEEEDDETAEDDVPARPIRGQAKRATVRGSLDEVEVKNNNVAAAGGRRVRGRSMATNQRRKDEQDVNDSSVVEPEVTFISFLSLYTSGC